MDRAPAKISVDLSSSLSELVKAYSERPLFQLLVQLIPVYGPFIDVAVREIYIRYSAKKYKIFFDELGKGSIKLNPALIDNHDFLFCYFKTIQAVQKSRRAEKVQYLARALRKSFASETIRDVDEYEEVIAVIDDLSFNELRLMSILAKFEKRHPHTDEDQLKRTFIYWEEFIHSASSELSVPQEMIHPMLIRLQRSGCYQEFVGTYFDYKGGQGNLTKLYYRIEEISGDVTNTDE